MAVIKKKDITEDNGNLFNVDEFLDIFKNTNEIINDEIYDNEEGIEEIRKSSEEGLKSSEEEAERIKSEINANYDKNKKDLEEVISVDSIVEKLEEELNNQKKLDPKDRVMKINYMEKNIKMIKDSLTLNYFIEKTFITRKNFKKDEVLKVMKTAENKLKSVKKYSFASLKEIRSSLNTFIDTPKYVNSFLYYFSQFIIKESMEDTAVYISFILNNIKYIKLYPELPQNDTIKNSINSIIYNFK